MPGFAVLLEAAGAAARAEGVEVEGEATLDRRSRNDVPDPMAADEAGKEIDVVWRVGGDVPISAPMAAKGEGVLAVESGGLDLDTPDAGAGIDPDVVGFVVAEWLADGKTSSGGLQHEIEFGKIADVLGVLAARAAPVVAGGVVSILAFIRHCSPGFC